MLVLLFVKYVSDKYAGKPYAQIVVPKGASFADMVALKGKSDISAIYWFVRDGASSRANGL